MEKWEEDLLSQVDSKKDVKEFEPKYKLWQLYINLENKLALFTFLCLAFLMLLAFEYKSGGTIRNWMSSRFQKQKVVEVIEPQKEIDLIDLQKKIVELESKNKELEEKLLWNSQRIGLMGIMLNENFILLKNNSSKDGLIFLGRDWKISKMPKNLELTEQDKQILEQFIETSQ